MAYFGDREKYRQRSRTLRPEHGPESDPISREVYETYDLVPEIGNGYRWYDYPYRILGWIVDGWLRRALPGSGRRWIFKGINYLHLFNEHDRNKARSLESLHHNVFVPEDEHVNVAGIWLVELFPPTELPALEAALARNGWDRPRPYEDGNREALQRARSGSGAYWWRLVNIVGRDSKWFVPEGVSADLPDEIEYVALRAIQVGAGLTAVVAEVHLSDAAAKSLDIEWHRTHEPILLKDQGRLQPLDRQWATFWEVQSARKRLHAAARDWLATRLPGFFALNNEPQPLLDLLLFDSIDPTVMSQDNQDRETSMKTHDALRALGVSAPVFHQLLSSDLPKLVLSPLDGQMHQRLGNDPTWTLWGSRPAVVEAIGEDSLRGYGGNDQNRAIASRLVDNMFNLFVMISVSKFLKVTQAKYAVIRDQASKRHGKFKPKSLKHLRESFLRHSLNLTSVHRDTTSFWKRSWRWEGDAEFRYHSTPREKGEFRQNESPKQEPESFNDLLRKRHEKEFTELIEADRDYREILSTVASLGASADSYKVSRLALWVAVASLVVAIGTVVVSDVGSNSVVVHLWSLISP